MSGRSLAYLARVPITEVAELHGRPGQRLAAEGIASVCDLLLHVPRRYVDRSKMLPIADVRAGDEVTLVVTISKVTSRRPKGRLHLTEAILFDGTSYLWAVWFNQPYREKHLVVGSQVVVSGKVRRFRGRLQMNSPVLDRFDREESLTAGRVVPVHPSVAKVPVWRLRKAVHNALGRSRPIADPLPAEIRERLGLVERDQAISDIHFPETLEDIEPARRRLVFDELFRLELALALSKMRFIDDSTGIAHVGSGRLAKDFLGGLPFALTAAQERAIEEIRSDLTSPTPMHRLLQGEVGSGKTVVAVAALLTGVEGSYQGAVMAPTEVLAEQHYLAMRRLLENAGLAPSSLLESSERPVLLALLTSNRAEVNSRHLGQVGREEVLELIAGGQVDIVVGTHALIQEGVHFSRLGVVVVDEQHRFGVHQRVRLKEKAQDADPDLLIMTATPIPRTLAMTLYGDLDITLLDEMPPGRWPVDTRAVTWAELESVYELIRREASQGRQTFVVCPLVEDSPKVEASSATASFDRLAAQLPDLTIGLLHGQLRPGEKEEVMASFREGEIDVLVATTVIEVGIDVPNATLMVVEDAQRFGLSQLHQLRGRVGRGSERATCVLIVDPSTEEADARIKAIVSTTDGFALAEEDLRIRGQGTVFGVRQSGATDLKLADLLRDTELLVEARREAFRLVADDPFLETHGDLTEEVRALLGDEAAWLSIS